MSISSKYKNVESRIQRTSFKSAAAATAAKNSKSLNKPKFNRATYLQHLQHWDLAVKSLLQQAPSAAVLDKFLLLSDLQPSIQQHGGMLLITYNLLQKSSWLLTKTVIKEKKTYDQLQNINKYNCCKATIWSVQQFMQLSVFTCAILYFYRCENVCLVVFFLGKASREVNIPVSITNDAILFLVFMRKECIYNLPLSVCMCLRPATM